MKFDRLALIERAQAAIVEAEKAAAERTAAAAKEIEGEEAAFLAEHGQDWSKFADNIRAANRAKRAVRAKDIPPALRGDTYYGKRTVVVFVPTKPAVHTAHVREYRRLIEVLETVTDDEVSSTGLAAIGIRNIP